MTNVAGVETAEAEDERCMGLALEEARRADTTFLQTSAGPRNAAAEASQRDKP